MAIWLVWVVSYLIPSLLGKKEYAVRREIIFVIKLQNDQCLECSILQMFFCSSFTNLLFLSGSLSSTLPCLITKFSSSPLSFMARCEYATTLFYLLGFATLWHKIIIPQKHPYLSGISDGAKTTQVLPVGSRPVGFSCFLLDWAVVRMRLFCT